MSIAIRIGGLAVGSSGGLNPNQGWSTLNDGTTSIRRYVLDGYGYTDKTLTSAGFAGTEGVDWENIDKVLIPGAIWWNTHLFPEIEVKMLFWGMYSEISGGQMPNKVSGSSDFLTVTGVTGSETYQCPDTAQAEISVVPVTGWLFSHPVFCQARRYHPRRHGGCSSPVQEANLRTMSLHLPWGRRR